MVLDSYRKQGDKIILPLAKRLTHVSPDILSWIAFLAAVTAGVCFFIGNIPLMFLGTISISVSALFDALDGRVAKLTGKASLKGDFLDHTLDRYADIFIIGGIAFGPLSRLSLGFLAILGILMTSYMGTQASAVGLKRNYSGIAGRADRLAVLILGTFFFALLSLFGLTSSISLNSASINLIEVIMIWFAISGHLTAVHRGVASWKDLKKSEKK